MNVEVDVEIWDDIRKEWVLVPKEIPVEKPDDDKNKSEKSKGFLLNIIV